MAIVPALPRPLVAQPAPAPGGRTRWKVETSEGLDAVMFLDALSGGTLYTDIYAEDLKRFAPRLPAAVRDDVPRLWKEAQDKGAGLLGPTIALIVSGAGAGDLAWLIALLGAPETNLRAPYQASPYWGPDTWTWFTSVAPRLKAVFVAMQKADFAGFLAERTGSALAQRCAELERALTPFDVITWQEKLTGRHFEPTIEIILLHFVQPHGVKVQGQRFLQSTDYGVTTTVRIAAHEMLHPGLPSGSPAQRAVLEALSADPLFPRIAKEHDPKWGYTSLEGLIDEDCCQALDQLIDEAFGVAHNPADRWRASDDGIHVLAGALYGMLRADHWLRKGGSFEQWIEAAARDGRFKPEVLHPIAARVLDRPADRLWPLAPAI